MPGNGVDNLQPSILDVIKRHWGFTSLRPHQAQAIQAILSGRDSLVVLPTGGGKSLCYQAPAVLRGDTTVVISPLISLMKDQVDSLQACGIPAVQIDSSLTSNERYQYEQDILQGAVRLLFVSPERLVLTDFCNLLRRIGVKTFAIDEAHCISHWGHDFRPEYRQLDRLRDHFPDASIHAYTATATERVRDDVIKQLGLRNPAVLVGNFDRPNLTYRVLPRLDMTKQILEVLERHKKEAGIIYCIRRVDVDDLADRLKKQGVSALPYHAGMTPDVRRSTQEAFATEKCDVIVATVAFGMGIDRSNIRFVLHAAMPKSIEHYQQETGRAGRDGLEAECVLLHSSADTVTWKSLITRSATEAGADPEFIASAHRHIDDMDRYCRGAVCRHAALVRYFGQEYPNTECNACDMCLGDTEPVPDAQVMAQKILSCVARVKESFGINHVIGVLRGENTVNIRKWYHEELSTYGLLKGQSKVDLRDWVYQLIGQEVLVQEGSDYPILRLNPASWEVMKGSRSVRLVQLKRDQETKGTSPGSWEGVDRELFDALRDLRRRLADERQVRPYVIFSDATLRQLAQVRPSGLERMRLIYGIGDAKLRDFGPLFFQMIDEHAQARRLTRDCPIASPSEPAKTSGKPNTVRDAAFNLFRQGKSVAEVVEQTNRARTTVTEYFCDFIAQDKPANLYPWINDHLYQRIAAAARTVGTERLKPIFIALGEQVPYDDIRMVLAHMRCMPGATHEPAAAPLGNPPLA
jgi:ATP-dependent DNA helicase RecQ